MRKAWQGAACAIVLLLAGPCLAQGASAESPIGKVRTLAGSVTIERDGTSLTPAMGEPIFQQDVLVTGMNGSLGVVMIDDTVLSLGPDSELILSDYAFDSGAYEGRMTADMRRGTLALTSGEIPKASPGALQVRTNRMIMGIRGTTILVSAE
ncbi:FecR family protein [Zavarzinia sp. CC-PAN008]|uniref:FecR family protein n=1 Tax=Zavarzinia sp. CC-PAN008 TaxID=3243332 RepID=UPI003F74842D